jgi:hypothetical protein
MNAIVVSLDNIFSNGPSGVVTRCVEQAKCCEVALVASASGRLGRRRKRAARSPITPASHDQDFRLDTRKAKVGVSLADLW